MYITRYILDSCKFNNIIKFESISTAYTGTETVIRMDADGG